MNVMKRILLVGQDQPLWRELRQSPGRFGNRWVFEFSVAGEHALSLTRQRFFNAVVADAKLPDMAGISLLDEIIVSHPHAVRIVLSEFNDLAETVNCVARVHRHLIKPCDASALSDALDAACAADSWLPNPNARRLLSRLTWVPSPPKQYFAIAEEMASPAASLEAIGKLISTDPSLAAKILQLANAAVLGLHLEVARLDEAVAYLGFDVTRCLVLLAHTFAEFDKLAPEHFSAETLWSHSALVARFAKEVAALHGLSTDEEEQAYTGGLLHDLGKVVLAANLPEKFSQALRRKRRDRITLQSIEAELFGADHAELGACLLGIWGLPVAVVESVGVHHNPSRSSSTRFSPVAAVHIANAFAHQVQSADGENLWEYVDRSYLERVGVANRLEAWSSCCINESYQQVQMGG